MNAREFGLRNADPSWSAGSAGRTLCESLRKLEEVWIRLATTYILELVGAGAKSGIVIGTLDQRHQVVRIPALVDHTHIAVIAHSARGDRHRDPRTLAGDSVYKFLAKLLGLNMGDRVRAIWNFSKLDALHGA